jgi:hypothetical protein
LTKTLEFGEDELDISNSRSLSELLFGLSKIYDDYVPSSRI